MNSGFQYDRNLSSGVNLHAISFQSSGVASTSEMVMIGDYYLTKSSTATGVVTTSGRYLGNSSAGNGNSGYTQSGNSSSSVPGLKHDAGLAVEWLVEEQHKLEEGLSKFSDEPSIMRYIKIAATLRDKTVRDVALRCRWMTRKRRKQDDPHMGKKLKDKKDQLLESSSKPCISSAPTLDVAMNNRAQIDGNSFEALSGSIRHLLEQNNQVLGQISANMSSMKLQDNINLFSHMKNNISAILNDIKYIPGPPLPVSLNKDLAHNILPTTSQRMTHQT